MEQTNPNMGFNPGANKKNILMWILVIFVALVIVFFSASYIEKLVEKNKAEKQNQPAGQKELLPSLVCNFSSDEEASQKAKEEKSISACLCIQDEQVKLRCQEELRKAIEGKNLAAGEKGKRFALLEEHSFFSTLCCDPGTQC